MFAVIKDGKVDNIIVADSLEIAEAVTNAQCVEVTDVTLSAHIGLGWDGSTFEQPPVPETLEEAPDA